MGMEKDYKQLFIEYCNKNWDLEWYEVAKALDIMEKMRCPLSMANEVVSDYIRDLADDFEIDNDLDDDWYFDTIDDEDEFFFELDIFPTESK